MNFGKNMQRYRTKEKITQAQLAKSVGITQVMICGIEKGIKVPSLAVACEIARVLNTTVDDLCKGV